MIDISDVHTSYPDSWVEDVPQKWIPYDPISDPWGIYKANGGHFEPRHTVRHEHGGWDAWYALSDAGKIAKVQAFESQSGCGEGCIFQGGMRIPRDDYVEINRRLAEQPYSSRGVLIYPNKPFGSRPAKERTDQFTWDNGMPRIHTDGSLYKISEMDPVHDRLMFEEQVQRLKNLKAILDSYPECKIPDYNYSAIDEVFGPAAVTFKVREVGGTDTIGIISGAHVVVLPARTSSTQTGNGVECTTDAKGNCMVKLDREKDFKAIADAPGYNHGEIEFNSGHGGYHMMYLEVIPHVPEDVIPPYEEEIPPYVPEALPTVPEDKKKKYLKCTLPLLSMLPPLPYFEGLPVPPGFEVIEK